MNKKTFGNFLVVQWLGLHSFTAVGKGSVSGQETRLPQAVRRSQKLKIKTLNHVVEFGVK